MKLDTAGQIISDSVANAMLASLKIEKQIFPHMILFHLVMFEMILMYNKST